MTPGNHGKPWTQNLIDELRTQFRDGLSPTEIAAAHGRTVNAIVGELKAIGCLTVVGKAYHPVEAEPWITFDEIRSTK